MNRIQVLIVTVLLVGVSLGAHGAEPAAPTVEEIRLTVHPAAPPVPPMRYHFMPDVVDQVPGNAALMYLSAAQRMAAARAEPSGAASNSQSDSERIDAWLAMPPKDLPIKEVTEVLNRYAGALYQLRLASRRDHCDFDLPYRTEGFRTLLPYLNDARELARLAALSARSKIAGGDFAGAVADASLPVVQAHHLNDQAFLVQLMLASALDQLALQQIQDLIVQPNSPNLYWALGDLPTPLLDFRASMKMERAGAFFSVPQLIDARAGKLTAAQWRDAVRTMNEMRNNLHSYGYQGASEQLMVALVAVREYPLAKQYLAEQHVPPAQIQGMQVSQALGLYHVGMFDRWSQEIDKCLTLPFPEGIVALARAEDELRRSFANNSWSLMDVFAPPIRQPYVSLARVDRRVAILRTVEAVRAYAAANQGRPPASLAEITETPALPDPMTGKSFEYRVDGDQVTIEGPAIEQAAPTQTGIRIILQLAH